MDIQIDDNVLQSMVEKEVEKTVKVRITQLMKAQYSKEEYLEHVIQVCVDNYIENLSQKIVTDYSKKIADAIDKVAPSKKELLELMGLTVAEEIAKKLEDVY